MTTNQKAMISAGFVLLTLTCVILAFSTAISHIRHDKMVELVRTQTRIVDKEVEDRVKQDIEHFQQMADMDLALDEFSHNQEVITSRVDVLDQAVDGDRKHRARVKVAVNAIKQTLPEYGNPLPDCPKVPSSGETLRIADAVVRMSDKYAVPASLIMAIIRQESAFCQKALSRAGARGYMQLMPATATEVAVDIGAPLHIWRGRDNIQLGTAYIGQMLMEFEDKEELAVAAYNAGPNHVKKVLAGEVSKFYNETSDYIEKVTAYRAEYDTLGLK